MTISFWRQVENILQLTASLPNGSRLRNELNGRFIETLWNNLAHPPISYLGDEFRYRTADGSNNVCLLLVAQRTDEHLELMRILQNIMYPSLGAAGSHYAQSVAPKHEPTVELPDPSIIFDSEILNPPGAGT